MKNLYILILNICFVCLLNLNANAQIVLIDADKQFTLYNFDKAIDLYEQAYKKKASLHAAERLVECYRYQNDYKQVESWAAIAAAMPKSSAENILDYAKALQNNSKYTEAKIQFKKYIDLKKDVPLTLQNKWFLSCDSAISWIKNPKNIKVLNAAKLNSPKSDWGTTVVNGNVVFVSDRGLTDGDVASIKRPFLKFDGKTNPDKKIYGWTGNQYLKLFKADKMDSVKYFPLPAETDYHVGPASFTADGKTVFFALTKIGKDLDYEKVKNIKGKLSTVRVEIYSAVQNNNGDWSEPFPFKYNNAKEYSVGDPFITADGKSLYFSSDMDGGKGGTDLYVSMLTDNGNWGLPINLKEVNTEGNERTPLFDEDNNFYFSSDGRIGMGGLDIFKAKLVGGKISEPKNMGYPTNSPQDDFAFTPTSATTGYLSSNRVDGLGGDDIYSYLVQKIIAHRLTGVVYDKKTLKPLNNAMVTLKDGANNIKVLTGDDGKFNFNLDLNTDYNVAANRTDFISDDASFTTKNLTESAILEQNLYLSQIELHKEIRLENIYYDFDKFNIRPDAAIELDKLVKILNDNPTIWIELGSHTDSRGDDKYNQSLSQKRANSAVSYIISRGISKNRITAKGYGESVLLNKCSNGVACTIAEHQLNRRTEFKITKM